MTTISKGIDRTSWKYNSRLTSYFQLALTAIVAFSFLTGNDQGLSQYYFLDCDIYLLLFGSLVLIASTLAVERGSVVPDVTRTRLVGICLTLAIFTYVASFIIFHRYAMSRDEQSAEFAATYFSSGHLGWPIPAHLRDLGRAMMPLYTNVRPESWTSDYRPINAAIRALFGLLGDQWMAGSALLVLGIVSLWSCARRIWPDQPHAATIGVVMAATSAQILLTAATPFAMTGHFALNALWLACFLRGGRGGHGAAIIVGLFASGLHQVHFHITFVFGFVLWLATERRYGLALLYAASCVAYWDIWNSAYPALLNTVLGSPAVWVDPKAGSLPPAITRLLQLQPGESFTRFIAWQNILLVPLALLGTRSTRRDQNDRILMGCTFACIGGLLMPVMQDHGLGYRYLHHLLPCFCLLAAGGWLRLERSRGRPLSSRLLWISVAFSVGVTLPVTIWRTMVWAAPYERAHALIAGADADYVFVDTRAGAYLESIVRVDETRSTPVLLDLGYVPEPRLRALCAGSRTMVFGEVQARSLGIARNLSPVVNEDETARHSALLKRLRCVKPVPVS